MQDLEGPRERRNILEVSAGAGVNVAAGRRDGRHSSGTCEPKHSIGGSWMESEGDCEEGRGIACGSTPLGGCGLRFKNPISPTGLRIPCDVVQYPEQLWTRARLSEYPELGLAHADFTGLVFSGYCFVHNTITATAGRTIPGVSGCVKVVSAMPGSWIILVGCYSSGPFNLTG
jgi:hypothetical protein